RLEAFSHDQSCSESSGPNGTETALTFKALSWHKQIVPVFSHQGSICPNGKNVILVETHKKHLSYHATQLRPCYELLLFFHLPRSSMGISTGH
ncbi:hypothetical protein, partial [Agrobacterium tumefaciens]|uniref:hypothetical protein n=1 Tax=Agrobacterium tumefaciens TaxID=358 RepID=UPI000ABD1132